MDAPCANRDKRLTPSGSAEIRATICGVEVLRSKASMAERGEVKASNAGQECWRIQGALRMVHGDYLHDR